MFLPQTEGTGDWVFPKGTTGDFFFISTSDGDIKPNYLLVMFGPGNDFFPTVIFYLLIFKMINFHFR